MQLKKNPRDDRYSDLSQAYTEQPDASESEFPGRRRELEEETEVTRPAAAPARAESVIDAESKFDGKYETAQDLRILGSVSGEIVCRGLLTIERDATAKAKIQSQDVQVRGRVEGDIVAGGRLLITATGVISGTIKAATLVVEEGATVRGSVETVAPGAVTDLPTTTRERSSANSGGKESSASKDASDESEDQPASGTGRGSGRWNRTTREVPSFALVSSEERASGD